MESFIKPKGMIAIQGASQEALEVTMKNLSLEANTHLINAAYAESLIPSVDEQVKQYDLLIDATNGAIADIEEQATHALSAQEGYTIRKGKKPLEATLRSYQQGKDRMLERKATALEKINAHRFDAQAIMHRIAYLADITPISLGEQLTKHIENQQAPAAEAEAEAIIAEESAEATPDAVVEPTEDVKTE